MENDHRFVFGAAIVGTIAFVALCGLSWRVVSVSRANSARRAELAQVQADVARLGQQRQDLETFFNDPGVMQVRDRSAFLNGLIQERSFPWTRIFMDFENLLPEGVRIVNIGPRLVAGHVELHMSVGAANDDAKLKFLRALEHAPAFSHVALMAESRPSRQNDIDKVYLELVAQYDAH